MYIKKVCILSITSMISLLWSQSYSNPQTAELIVTSNVDKSEITIGDKIRYQITVQYPDTGTLELPSVLGNLGGFEVKEYEVSQPKKIKNGREQTWNFFISTFTTGQYSLPPQLVEYTPENDTVEYCICISTAHRLLSVQ